MRPTIALLLLLAMLASGCRSSKDIIVAPNPPDLSGTYRSAAAVGELGELTLILWLREGTERTYDAELAGPAVELDEVKGAGTLGNDHLILIFQIGEPEDYYFQGFVEGGAADRSIEGTFIFPEQPEQLSVLFERTGAAPPRPEPEEDDTGDNDSG